MLKKLKRAPAIIVATCIVGYGIVTKWPDVSIFESIMAFLVIGVLIELFLIPFGIGGDGDDMSNYDDGGE